MGKPNTSPSQLIKPSYHGGYEVYDTQNGLSSITPSNTIKENPYGGLDIYEHKNGTDAKLYILKKAKKFQKNRLNSIYTPKE